MRKILFLSIVIIITQLIYGSRGVACGDSFSELDKKISLLQEENQQIELQVASLSSIKVISQRLEARGLAQGLSFTGDKNVSVALKP